jgi:hypothetical protein
MPNIGPYTWSVVAVVAALTILLVVAVTAVRRRRTAEQLRMLFGPEYDRAIRLYGDRSRAEAALEHRRKRLAEMAIHELPPVERDRFRAEWAAIQAASPADSAMTLERADGLLAEILRAEGCTTVDPDERKIDLSLLHPNVAEDYRAATEAVAGRNFGRTTPEECRRAMMRFASIFDVILGEPDLRARLQKVS